MSSFCCQNQTILAANLAAKCHILSFNQYRKVFKSLTVQKMESENQKNNCKFTFHTLLLTLVDKID